MVLLLLFLFLLPLATTSFTIQRSPNRIRSSLVSTAQFAGKKNNHRPSQKYVSIYQREGSYKVWREPARRPHFIDYMMTSLGGYQRDTPPDNLKCHWIYYIRAPVSGEGHRGGGNGRARNQKVLVFTSLDQVHEFKAYLSTQSTFGSTATLTLRTGCYNSWYEKLPKGLVRSKNRRATVRLLQQVLDNWETRSRSEIEESLKTRYNPDTQRWYWKDRSIRSRKNECNNKRSTHWMQQNRYR